MRWEKVGDTLTDGNSALVVLHTFAEAPKEMEILLPLKRNWRIAEQLSASEADALVQGAKLECPIHGDFSARVVWLMRQ